MTVMTPMPDTAPRANGLAKTSSSAGMASMKRLRSQKPDQGATTRIKPASRKYAAKRIRVRKEMSTSGLHAGEAIDAGRNVPVIAGVRLKLEEDRKRP
jgi:hypothetical protein